MLNAGLSGAPHTLSALRVNFLQPVSSIHPGQYTTPHDTHYITTVGYVTQKNICFKACDRFYLKT